MAETAAKNAGQQAPNTHRHYDVSRKDLPVHCPIEGASVWNSHPRVYIPVEETGEAKCPYCGAEFKLID